VNVSVRPATADDVADVARIAHAEPGAEAIALMGSVDLARRYGEALIRMERIPAGAKRTIVAEQGGLVVGVAQYVPAGVASGHRKREHIELLLKLVGPVGLARRLPAIRARARVEIAQPPNSVLIGNLHVDPGAQQAGVGSALVDWIDSEAMTLGATRLALITILTNPALGWYERMGFVTVQTATDLTYERRFGIPGRVLLEKPLPATEG
jgi:predicted N-acetyltransferase YhbS